MREQLLEEVDLEGQQIINECNKLLDDISKSSEQTFEKQEV